MVASDGRMDPAKSIPAAFFKSGANFTPKPDIKNLNCHLSSSNPLRTNLPTGKTPEYLYFGCHLTEIVKRAWEKKKQVYLFLLFQNETVRQPVHLTPFTSMQ